MICFIYLVNSEFLVIWLEKRDIDFNDSLNTYLISVLKYLMCNTFLQHQPESIWLISKRCFSELFCFNSLWDRTLYPINTSSTKLYANTSKRQLKVFIWKENLFGTLILNINTIYIERKIKTNKIYKMKKFITVDNSKIKLYTQKICEILSYF